MGRLRLQQPARGPRLAQIAGRARTAPRARTYVHLTSQIAGWSAKNHTADALEPITLPLNFYNVLHVNRASSREAVKRAYERIINSPPDIGYSQDTLFSRAVLLKNAAECLGDLDSRRAYDAAAAASGGAHTLDVTTDNLPGALALLQEAGESKLVLQLGYKWLEAHASAGGPIGRASDVAAAVALALCDLAAEALEEESGQVLGACERLEEALALLMRHGLAPQLQEQIENTLDDFSARYCLELLALPLRGAAACAERRKRGLALARGLLWGPQDHQSLAGARGEFVECVRTHTTASEQIDLYNPLPAGANISMREQIDCALALVAVGLERRSPHMLAKADRLYASVQAAVEREGAPVDVSVERASIALLLGDSRRALERLGLEERGPNEAGDGGGRCNPEVLAFVQENSPGPSDLLPGVYALARGWVDEAVLGGFRESNGQEADLEGWFQSPWVQAYAQAVLATRTLSPVSVARAAGAALAALAAFLASVVARLLGALRSLLPGGSADSAADVRGGGGGPGDGAAHRGAAWDGPAGARDQYDITSAPSPSGFGYHDAPPPGEPWSGERAASPAPAPRRPVRQRLPAAPPASPAYPGLASFGADPAAVGAPHAGGAGAGRGAGAAVAAARVQDQFEQDAEDAVIEFDRSKLEKEVVTIAELKRRLGAVLSTDEDGESAAGKWRQAGGGREQHWEQGEGDEEEDDTDAKLFQGEVYQAKRAYLERLEVQMWDSEPAASSGGPVEKLRRWAPQLLGAALLAGVVAWGQVGRGGSGAAAPGAAPAAAAVQKGAAATSAQKAGKAAEAGAKAAAAAAPAATKATKDQVPEPPAARAAVRGAAAPADPCAGAVVVRGSPLNAQEAARQVRRLQVAKAQAMGPDHRVGALRGVMRGRLLRQWRGQAERARQACSHYVYQVKGVRVERVGPWLPSGWLARCASRGAEVAFTESDTVAVRPDAAATASAAAPRRGGGPDSVDRTLRRTLRLQRARWVPWASWKVVDILDVA